jgi:FG-GAP repeat
LRKLPLTVANSCNNEPMALLAITLLLGAASGLPAGAFQQPDPPEIVWADGPTSRYYYFGASVAWLGDQDGDQNDDYAVGTRGPREVRVYSGASKTELARVVGGTSFGASLANIGDVNGDNLNDFAAGTPFAGGSTGEVRIFAGGNFIQLYDLVGNYPSHLFGQGLASVGDTDGDGVPDFLVYARDQGGLVSMHSGADGTLLFELQGAGQADEFGKGMAGIHDFDGDGIRDFLIGAPGNGSGTVTLHSGFSGAVLATMQEAGSLGFGTSIADIGDVDGDGISDFAVGAPTSTYLANPAAGAVWIYSGSSLAQIHHLVGRSRNQNLGYLVDAAGDYDQDGLADFLVASPGSDPNGITDAGKVELISGANLTVLGVAKGTKSFERMPTSMAGNGDGHRDLHPDFLVGISDYGPNVQGRVEMWGAPSPWFQVENLVGGSQALLSADLCIPGGTVQFWFSRQGSGPTNTVVGTALLTPPFLMIGSAIVNLSGHAEILTAIPSAISGSWLYGQALEFRPALSPRLSTGITRQVQ